MESGEITIPTIDKESTRFLIGVGENGIDGGVFRRDGYPGIVVDSKKLQKYEWFIQSRDFMLQNNTNMLGLVKEIVKKDMPLASVNTFNEMDKNRYSLNYFIPLPASKSPMGIPDAQVLYAALLLEIKLNQLKEQNGENSVPRKVSIILDQNDGHAIACYEGKSGKYIFDPAKDDSGFTKQAEMQESAKN